MKIDDYMTQAEAAGVVGVTERTLCRWRKEGEPCPPRYRRLGRWLYKKHEVEAFANARKGVSDVC